MEFEQLRHFLRAAELENFTRAAEQVGLSQSAFSRSIARLEEELGQPLFERQTKKVALTDAGKVLFDRSRKILAMVDDVREEICDDGETGNVRVAAIPTIAPYFLPDCLRQFQRHHPRAHFIVSEDTTDKLLKNVAEGEVDVVIAALPISAKYVHIEPLLEEELLLVSNMEHPLARKKSICTEDLQSLPFVLLNEAHCLSENIVAFCRQKTFHPVTVERTSQLAMVQELVSLGHGISLVPAMARRKDMCKSRVYRSLSGVKPTRTVVMISNPYRFHSRLMQGFQEHVHQFASELM